MRGQYKVEAASLVVNAGGWTAQRPRPGDVDLKELRSCDRRRPSGTLLLTEAFGAVAFRVGQFPSRWLAAAETNS